MCNWYWKIVQDYFAFVRQSYVQLTTHFQVCNKEGENCIWICLCCNLWLCYIVTIVALILLTIWVIIATIIILIPIITCEATCIVLVIFLAIMRDRGRAPRCFDYTTTPTPIDSGNGPIDSPPTEPPAGPVNRIAARLRMPSVHVPRSASAEGQTRAIRFTSSNRRATCGCVEALIGIAVSVPLAVLILTTHPWFSETAVWATVCIGFAFACLGAFFGKLTALLLASKKGTRAGVV